VFELAGFAALIAAIIEVLKRFGLPDGKAGLAAVIGNIVVYAIGQFGGFYGWNLSRLDNFAAMLAEIILTLVGMFVVSLVTHKAGREGELPLFKQLPNRA